MNIAEAFGNKAFVGNYALGRRVESASFWKCSKLEVDMGFGRGVLLWLLGIPIPIIILLALFWHH
jgi:hypothetical protein